MNTEIEMKKLRFHVPDVKGKNYRKRIPSRSAG
jgi:hypothetical protein